MILNAPSKSMWRRRVSIVEAIYSDLITSDFEGINLISLKEEWIDFENKVFNDYSSNKNEYVKRIGQFLKSGWEFERLNLILSAILLEAISEFNAIKTPKNIIISQSVKTAKNYCGEEEFKIVNGLLDNFLTEKQS